jgi:6,7-dimethyl-8-ribityllumazine synthase
MKAAPQSRPTGHGLRVAVLRSAFNASIVTGLAEGALRALAEMGVSDEAVEVLEVPGAFELATVARAAAESRRFDAIVALGAVIRGETDHYEHIAREAAAGLAAVGRETGVPVGFGVLTVARVEQAQRRAAPGPENKGAEAARAAVGTAQVLRRLRLRARHGGPRALGARRRGPRRRSPVARGRRG